MGRKKDRKGQQRSGYRWFILCLTYISSRVPLTCGYYINITVGKVSVLGGDAVSFFSRSFPSRDNLARLSSSPASAVGFEYEKTSLRGGLHQADVNAESS